jgi:hypothetical protein
LPLSPPAPRKAQHLRTIEVHGYFRDDGLFEIEGHLFDRWAHALDYPGGHREAGEPIHSMRVRLTFDATRRIVGAEACSDAVPLPGLCDTIGPSYAQLVGVRIGPGFRKRVRDLFSGMKGCTHITELIGTMGTSAYQTLAGEVDGDPDVKPFQLDGCHALDTSGQAVATFYPKWYRKRPGAEG